MLVSTLRFGTWMAAMYYSYAIQKVQQWRLPLIFSTLVALWVWWRQWLWDVGWLVVLFFVRKLFFIDFNMFCFIEHMFFGVGFKFALLEFHFFEFMV